MSHTHECFQNSKEPIIAKVYRKFIEPGRRHLPRSGFEGLSRLCTETKYSFFCSKIMVLGLLKNSSCRIIGIPGTSYIIMISIPISKRSPYKEFFNCLWVHLLLVIFVLNYAKHWYLLHMYSHIINDSVRYVSSHILS